MLQIEPSMTSLETFGCQTFERIPSRHRFGCVPFLSASALYLYDTKTCLLYNKELRQQHLTFLIPCSTLSLTDSWSSDVSTIPVP